MNIPNGRGKDKRGRAVPRPDIEVMKDDLATLRRDLMALFAHIEASGIDGAGGVLLKAAGQMGSDTVRFCDTVSAGVRSRSRELRAQVERRPLAMALAACAVGAVVARMGDRRPRRR